MTAILLVHLDDPDTGAVSFKPDGIKGARRRGAKSVDDALRMADAVMPLATPENPRTIDYVERLS
jgi:hypothetical protein